MITGIITTYSREIELVERAIKSMLQQSYPVDEIIVVDDNETGNPLSLDVKKMCAKYPKVKYIKQNGNQGACAARNLGIANASGEYIGFLDDDDYWMPEKIEKQMNQFLNADSHVGLVYCSGIVKNEETGEEEDYYNIASPCNVTFENQLHEDYIGSTSNPLIKKECFDKVGGFWEILPARQDYEMWIRIAKEFMILGVHDKLFVHTIHGGEQITKNVRKSYTGYKNIYIRYKNDIKQHPKDRIHFLNWIIRNRSGITIEVLMYGLERQWLQIRYKLPREQ